MFDLDAYLRRIAYDGPRAPTLDVLRALHARHTQAITFENLNALMGLPVPIDVDAVQEKIVRGGRGGWCFEQNLLFGLALRACGFTVTDLAARVLWGLDEEAVTRRSHMVLRVMVDGEPFIADVGFGGQTLTGPIRLLFDVAQSTPHEDFRFVRARADEYKLQAFIGGQWRSLYRFDLQPQFPVDYEVISHFLSTHPASQFRTTLRVARALPGLRHGLLNNQLSTHYVGGGTEKRTLTSVAEVRGVLTDLFGLTLPAGPDLDRAIARVCNFP
ncbi:MAG TPA: arylamine N-acetyltransferase [Steroidobacteraceae bacterium]|nr:arylamine N-acetyltransferase [Steroidobacteraceae bacterium]